MITIHGVPISVHTRKVIVAAHAKGLDIVVQPVIPFDPPAGWTMLSPTGKIPALSHDEYNLAESSAICAYFERLSPEPPLYPTDAQDYAAALALEQFATGALFSQIVHPLFYQQVVRPKILAEGDPDSDIITRIQTQTVPGIFGYLEGLVHGQFVDLLVGDSFGVAEIAVASNLVNYTYLGHRIDPARYPRLANWFGQCIAHPAFANALLAERPFVAQMGLDPATLADVSTA